MTVNDCGGAARIKVDEKVRNTVQATAKTAYRHNEFQTRNLHPSICIDGVKVAQMDDGKFFKIKLEPGKHTISINKSLVHNNHGLANSGTAERSQFSALQEGADPINDFNTKRTAEAREISRSYGMTFLKA